MPGRPLGSRINSLHSLRPQGDVGRVLGRQEDAVRPRIAATARVVTAAALVMVCVFALFGTLSSLQLKHAGVGLAAALLIDATLIRAVPVARPGELVPPRRLQAPQGAPTLRSTRANSP